MSFSRIPAVLSRLRNLCAIACATALSGCYETVDWDHEAYRLPEEQAWTIVDGYSVGVGLLPTHYGKRGASYRGPYNVQVFSLEDGGYTGKYTHLSVRNITVTHLLSGREIQVLSVPVEDAFDTVSRTFAANIAVDKPIEPDFANRENVEIAVDVELVNRQTTQTTPSHVSYVLVPEHTTGREKIPVLTQ